MGFWKDVQEYTNPIVNFVTGGFAGVNENGDIDWDEGYASQAIDETLGGITGRNQARKQMNETEAALVKEEERRAVDRQNEAFKKQQLAYQSSFTAQAARGRTEGATSRSTSSGSLLGGTDEANFLGV